MKENENGSMIKFQSQVEKDLVDMTKSHEKLTPLHTFRQHKRTKGIILKLVRMAMSLPQEIQQLIHPRSMIH